MKLWILTAALMLTACDGSSPSVTPTVVPPAPAVVAPIDSPATATTQPVAVGAVPDPISDVEAGIAPTVIIGDSIMYRWTDLCTHFDSCANAGIGGQTTDQMRARFDTDVMALHPAVVVIEGGINDMRTETSYSIDAIASMAAEAQASGARVIIGLAVPGYWQPSATVVVTVAQAEADTVSWNQQLRELANAYGYDVADFYTPLLNSDGSEDLDDFGSDWLHPNSVGYALMWTALQTALN